MIMVMISVVKVNTLKLQDDIKNDSEGNEEEKKYNKFKSLKERFLLRPCSPEIYRHIVCVRVGGLMEEYQTIRRLWASMFWYA